MSASALKKRILIVDDDSQLLEVLAILLRDAGYLVDEAEHALAAICAIVRAAPDLILADIRMPIVDGFGLVRQLKAHSDTQHIPVVAMTGCDSARARESALEAGYDDYLAKPIDARGFAQQVTELLCQHGPKRPARVNGKDDPKRVGCADVAPHLAPASHKN